MFKKKQYQRFRCLKINKKILLDIVESSYSKVLLYNFKIRNKVLKYRTFLKNKNCYICGLKGSFFAIEKDKRNKTNICTLNLYGINKNNEEILMTIDHIKPLSKGGKNELDNLKTCCYICNLKKGSKWRN